MSPPRFYDYHVVSLGIVFHVRALSIADAEWVATHPCKRNRGRAFCTADQIDAIRLVGAEGDDEMRRRLPLTEPKRV